MPFCLSIDYGSRYIGMALIEWPHNRVAWAGTFVVDPKPLNKLVDKRKVCRGIRRTRKTKKSRVRRATQAFRDIGLNTEQIRSLMPFVKRRGYGFDKSDDNSLVIDTSRDDVKASAESTLAAFDESVRDRVRTVLHRHMDTVIRPARFDNRNPTKCAWPGCKCNVPRKKNARRESLLQTLSQWLIPAFRESDNPGAIRTFIEAWVDDVLRDGLAKHSRRLKATVTEESFQRSWDRYRKQLADILEDAEGRMTYCREHALEYVQYVMDRRQPPQDTTFSLSSVGRREQIIFSRLWTYIRSRLLPLGDIVEVRIERVAFDTLKGQTKKRSAGGAAKELPDLVATDLYQQGPQYGFDSRLEMLVAEFDGRCAYCGEKKPLEVEHILARTPFGFDNYFNVVPACKACNGQKQTGPPKRIHEDAYTAYCEYLDQYKQRGFAIRHPYHDIKKGILNQLRNNLPEAEKVLWMVSNSLQQIGRTQLGPRPLARYLAQQITAAGSPCKPAWSSSRHTALYRSVLTPEYNKATAGVRNHAIDAIVIGCNLPKPLESRPWRASPQAVEQWFDDVRSRGPEFRDHIPVVECPHEPIQYFEEMDDRGYFEIKLASFNWNRDRQSSFGTEPIFTGSEILKRRSSAAELYNDLAKTPEKAIASILHPTLKPVLAADPEHAQENLLAWLRATLKTDRMGLTASARMRKQILDDFKTGKTDEIPQFVSVTRSVGNAKAKYSVSRERDGRPFQSFMAEAVKRAIYVGYTSRSDRSDPIIVAVGQLHRVERYDKNQSFPCEFPDDSPLQGRPHGRKGSYKRFLENWKAAFQRYCDDLGLVKIFCITQGCVVERVDGSMFQVKSLDISMPWARRSELKNIRRVYHSPLAALNTECLMLEYAA